MAADLPSDTDALRALEKSGSDLSKLHRVVFYLHFPDEESAAAAIPRLEDLAFAATIERDDAEDRWAVMATKRMYPAESSLAGLRAHLEAIAADGGGSYAGWRATQLD